MADLLRSGIAWLDGQRAAHLATVVTYRRAGEDDALVAATWGRTEYEVQDESGLVVGAQVMDFLISADAFPFDEPAAGDRIVAGGVIYEVLDLASQGHWRWSDPHRTTMRIHTKEIDSG